MTNSPSSKTVTLVATIAALTTIGLFTSLSGGIVQAQLTAATQASQSIPPTPKEQPDVA